MKDTFDETLLGLTLQKIEISMELVDGQGHGDEPMTVLTLTFDNWDPHAEE